MMVLPMDLPVAPVAVGSCLIIVPTYNEATNIALLIPKVFSAVNDIHVLVVDDNSPDGTAQVCESLTKTYPNLQVLKRENAFGLGRAYVAGFEFALDHRFDVIGTMDADLSHDPACLPAMLKLIAQNDVVIGSRYISGGGTVNWPLRRIVLSWLANKFARTLLRVPAHDLTSGFRLYRRKALEWIEPREFKSDGYSFLVEILYRAHDRGARIGESPIVFHDRTNGQSKLHSREIYRGAFSLFKLRFARIVKKVQTGAESEETEVVPAHLSLAATRSPRTARVK